MICDELVTKIAKNVQTYSLHRASLPILANHLTNLRRDGKIRAKSIQQWNRLRYDTATTRRNEIGMKHTVEVMISEQEVQDRVRQLGKEITEFYNGSEDLVLVGLLRGSFVFMADLARAIELTHQVDFMTASSYGNAMESTRDVRILKDLDDDIKGKDILLVEDIIDTGNTLNKVKEILSLREPNSVQICTLLDKPSRREVNVDVKWIGFEIPDEFVVGVGIDYAQKYRHLPYIGKVVPQE